MLSLLLLLLLPLLCTRAQLNGPIVPAPSPAPGVFASCNRTESCLPYSDRFQYSLDFLCCEQGNGWPAAHILNPLGVGIFFGSFATTLAVAFWFEAFEIGVLTFFTSFIIFDTTEIELETWAGSVLGDALVQGSIGAGLGALMLCAFRMPGMFDRWRLMSGWLRLKYALLWLAYGSTFIAPTFVSDDGERNYGLAIAIGVQLLYLGVLLPLLTNSKTDRSVVWVRERVTRVPDRTTTPWRLVESRRYSLVSLGERWRFFICWWLVNLTIASQAFGVLHWAPNQWYQTWTAAAFVALLLLVPIGVRWSRRRARSHKRGRTVYINESAKLS